jgi:superfamily II DNA or RNA helicase
MEDYNKFLETKKKTFVSSGFDIDESKLNKNLFDFQKYAVKTALNKGRFALFFDCGLGKTLMQLEWASQVVKETKGNVLVLTSLAVVEQTKKEFFKFNIDNSNIDVLNYDQLSNIDCSIYTGVVLDESSILKNNSGKTSQLIIDSFKSTPYKLACTATPSPNDHMELGNHSQFLGAMSYLEMLAMYFVHDGGETSKWRLRKHAKDPFWKYVSTWSWLVIIQKH